MSIFYFLNRAGLRRQSCEGSAGTEWVDEWESKVSALSKAVRSPVQRVKNLTPLSRRLVYTPSPYPPPPSPPLPALPHRPLIANSVSTSESRYEAGPCGVCIILLCPAVVTDEKLCQGKARVTLRPRVSQARDWRGSGEVNSRRVPVLKCPPPQRPGEAKVMGYVLNETSTGFVVIQISFTAYSFVIRVVSDFEHFSLDETREV